MSEHDDPVILQGIKMKDATPKIDWVHCFTHYDYSIVNKWFKPASKIRRMKFRIKSHVRKNLPTWMLRYLVWRNSRLRQAGRLPDEWYWADLDLWLRKEYGLRRSSRFVTHCYEGDV